VDLGDYWYQRGQTQKAKDIWKRLLTLVKPKAKGLAALGEVYLDHDLGEDALDVYKQAIDLVPGDVQMQKGYANALERVRKYVDAEKVLREVIAQAPGDVDARLVLERVLVNQGKVAAAIAILEELVKADPKSARAYYKRLSLYALQLYKDDDAIRYAAAGV